MEGSKRGRKRSRRSGKLLLILLVTFAGMLTALEVRCKTLRIAEIEIEPMAAPFICESVWSGVPAKAEKFWPLLWTSKRSYETAIERGHPVRARLLLKNWGRYKLEVEFLQPLFILYWENKYWCVSADGKMWLTVRPENDMTDLSAARRLPVLVWGGDRTSPFDIANADEGVYRSSLPVSLILGWYDSLEFLGWTEKTKALYTERREGQEAVRLIVSDGKGGRGAEILFPDTSEQWREAGMAMKTIYPDISKISSDIFIDMTYKGKIIVSNRVK